MKAARLSWITALALLLFLLGCSDAMSDKDYSHIWRQAVNDYRALAKNPEDPRADPMDNSDGTAEAHMRAASAISMELRKIADRFKDLKVAEDLKQLNEETYLFYRGQADAYSGYTEAIGSGDGNKIATAVDRLNNFAGERQQLVAGIIEKLGTKASMFRDPWKSVLVDKPAK